MARQQCIVGIGEAVLVEGGEQSQVEGAAADAALQAVRFGHRGIALTRIGQDPAGEELVRALSEAGVDVNHLQYDPDRPTARRRRMSITGRSAGDHSSESAFNHLQWDFDLDDVAQITDAAVFGLVAQRDGQSRSVIARFLDSCTHAIRLFDLTNRDSAPVDRRVIEAMLRRADAVVVDSAALLHIMPGSTGRTWRETVLKLLKQHDLAFGLTIEPAAPESSNGEPGGTLGDAATMQKDQPSNADASLRLVLHTVDNAWAGENGYESTVHGASILAILHGMLRAWEPSRTMQLAGDVADFSGKHAGQAIPDAILNP